MWTSTGWGIRGLWGQPENDAVRAWFIRKAPIIDLNVAAKSFPTEFTFSFMLTISKRESPQ